MKRHGWLMASAEAPPDEEPVAGGVPLYLSDGGTWKAFSAKSRELVPAGATDVWRASSATLPSMAPLVLGTNGLAGALAGTVELAYDDPVNPFLHRYHPMFDNKNGQFEPYDGPVESRNVSRTISLNVGEAGDGGDGGDGGDVDVMADASRAVSGSYQEKLAGLRAQEILVQGTFSLEKVMDGELVGNDE